MSDKVSLLKLAVQLRHAQFYAHMAHNLTCGPTFYQDHDAFGDLYKAYEGEYDAVIERFIGLGGSPSIYGVTKNALAMLEECQGDNKPSQRNDAACLLALNDYIESLLNEVAVLESRQTDAAVKDGH